MHPLLLSSQYVAHPDLWTRLPEVKSLIESKAAEIACMPETSDKKYLTKKLIEYHDRIVSASQRCIDFEIVKQIASNISVFIKAIYF